MCLASFWIVRLTLIYVNAPATGLECWLALGDAAKAPGMKDRNPLHFLLS
jgi:hypothetical protein